MTANPATREFQAPQPFRLAPPFAVPDTNPAHQTRPSPTLRNYLVRAELDQALDGARQHQIAELLAGHEPRIGQSPEGRTAIQLVLPGRDLWQSVLDAMVTLTNAGCAPTALSIVETGRPARLPRPAARDPQNRRGKSAASA